MKSITRILMLLAVLALPISVIAQDGAAAPEDALVLVLDVLDTGEVIRSNVPAHEAFANSAFDHDPEQVAIIAYEGESFAIFNRSPDRETETPLEVVALNLVVQRLHDEATDEHSLRHHGVLRAESGDILLIRENDRGHHDFNPIEGIGSLAQAVAPSEGDMGEDDYSLVIYYFETPTSQGGTRTITRGVLPDNWIVLPAGSMIHSDPIPLSQDELPVDVSRVEATLAAFSPELELRFVRAAGFLRPELVEDAAADPPQACRPVGPCFTVIPDGLMLAEIEDALVTPVIIKQDDAEESCFLLGLAPPVADGAPYTLYGWIACEGFHLGEEAPTGALALSADYRDGAPNMVQRLAMMDLSDAAPAGWTRFALTFDYNPVLGMPDELLLDVTLEGQGMVAVAVVGMVTGESAPADLPPVQTPFPRGQGPVATDEVPDIADMLTQPVGDGPAMAGVLADEEIIQTIVWDELFGGPAAPAPPVPDDGLADGVLVDGVLVEGPPGPEITVMDMGPLGQCLFVRNPPEFGEMSLSLAMLNQPEITSESYAIVGLVGYDVPGEPGMLEMLSHFPDGHSYFTRTVMSGPLAPLAGRSDWRVFRLPFTNEPGGRPPVALDMNLLLPSEGRVILGPTYLVQTRQDAPEPDPAGSTTRNRSGSSSPRKGVLLKSPWPPSRETLVSLGCLAVLVVLTSVGNWLIKRGKARRFVLVWLWGLIAVCGVFIGNFVVMMIWDKTYLISIIAIGVVLPFGIHFVNVLRRVNSRYADFELRKMSAKDAS
jgi:hypothetical protein